MNLLKRKVGVLTLVAPSMRMEFLPIDTYKKDVDEISSIKYEHDWEGLRQSILESRTPTQHSVRTDAFGEQFRCVKCNKRNRTT